MMAIKKMKTPEHSDVYLVGKTYFYLSGSDGLYSVLRAVRHGWMILGTSETLSHAKSLMLDSLIKRSMKVVDPHEWLRSRPKLRRS